MVQRLLLRVHPETADILQELADERNTEPAKLAHQWIRAWLFDKPLNPDASSMAAQASALVQLGTAPTVSGGKVTSAELEEAVKRYSIPAATEGDPPEGMLAVPLAQRVADVLPRTVAYADLLLRPDLRAQKNWNDLTEWATQLIEIRSADEGMALHGKDAEDEERALYPEKRWRPVRPKP